MWEHGSLSVKFMVHEMDMGSSRDRNQSWSLFVSQPFFQTIDCFDASLEFCGFRDMETLGAKGQPRHLSEPWNNIFFAINISMLPRKRRGGSDWHRMIAKMSFCA